MLRRSLHWPANRVRTYTPTRKACATLSSRRRKERRRYASDTKVQESLSIRLTESAQRVGRSALRASTIGGSISVSGPAPHTGHRSITAHSSSHPLQKMCDEPEVGSGLMGRFGNLVKVSARHIFTDELGRHGSQVESTWPLTALPDGRDGEPPRRAAQMPNRSPGASPRPHGGAVHQVVHERGYRSPIPWGAATDLVDCSGGLSVDCEMQPSSNRLSTCANVALRPQSHVCADTPTT